MKIKIIKFNEEYKTPIRAHYNDAGADVFVLNEGIDSYIYAGETKKFPLGFGLEIPDGYMACVYPKSGLTSKGIIAHIPPIDSGYRGEIHAIITNTTKDTYKFEKFDKIGQLVVTPVILCDFVEELDNNRGEGAFGSTGR
jgi:dUTP pyrophosphatase